MYYKHPSFGIYINFPFCPSKCNFCAFGSRLFDQSAVDRYMLAVEDELKFFSQIFPFRDREVKTVYVGGGTPTLICEELPLLLKNIKNGFRLDNSAEITVEAHPAGIRSERLLPLLREGFNRFSLGIQSFFDSDLVYMNRDHTVQEAHEAFRHARQAGFANMNIDLIYGLPNQTLSQWEKNIYSAVKLFPEHLSIYGLSLEEKTYLDYLRKIGKVEETDDELQAEMYLSAIQILEKEGYVHYEVSNFAKPGFESKHNLLYWSQGNFLGVGAHAASLMDGIHSLNETSIEGYIRKVKEAGRGVIQTEWLNKEELLKEALIFGLRKTSGVKLSELNPEYLPFLGIYLPKLMALARNGFLNQVHQEHFSPTGKGLLFSDYISMTLI